jgi:hypothetical protein
MAWCLPKEYADKFRMALKDRKLDPDKLVAMTSEQRRAYLGQFVGDWNAKYANTLFESKLLLKNQQRGFITFAKKFGGMSKQTEDELINKVAKLKRALNPQEGELFLADIIEKRLGVSLTEAEGKMITDLTAKMEEIYNPALKSWQQPIEYQRLRQQLYKFMREASPETFSITRYGKIKGKLAIGVSIARAIKVGMDISYTFRQAAGYIGTKEWRGAFSRLFSYGKSEIALDELEVKMLSHKYSEYALKYKKDLGLTLLGERFTQREENYAAKLIGKIPIVGNAERANVGFINDLRFHRFVNILEGLDKAGRGITDNPDAMKSLAQVIGASTGRGTLGSLEGAAKPLSTALFSPRWLASRFQILMNPLTKRGTARVEAIKSLARLAGVAVSVLSLYKAAGGDIELDPRSADFGKLKMGNTRIDMTGGTAPIIVLFTRVAMGLAGKPAFKSSTTGVVSLLNSKSFGAQTVEGVFTDFFLNKTSPLASVVRDLFRGENFEGDPVELKANKDMVKYLADQLLYPMIATQAYDAYTMDGGAVGTLATLSEFLGLGAQTYQPSVKQQIRDLYQGGDTEGAKNLLDEETKSGKISETLRQQIIRDKDLPNSVIYFRDLTSQDQKKLLEDMSWTDMQVFGWYANKDLHKDFSSISDEAKIFVEKMKKGEIKEPQWDKGEIKQEK